VTWRTHLSGGLASLYLIQPLLTPENLGALAIIASLGALLPDLDARESRLKNLTLGTGIAPFFLPALALHRLLGHRGPLHSLLGLLVMTITIGLPLTLLFGGLAPAALALGYASHLALDGATKSGVPLWFPSLRRVHLLPPRLRFTTGTPPEDIVLALLSVAALLLLLSRLLSSNS
jgi:inner membrane protein